jgi:phage terminase large subunit
MIFVAGKLGGVFYHRLQVPYEDLMLRGYMVKFGQLDELLYQTGLTNNDIANVLTSLGVDRRSEVYADSAEPKSIEELYRRGFNVKPTSKGADSVNAGIDIMKRYKIFITPRSKNLEKELRNYKWTEDKNGNLLNKPIDAFNHAIDAARYAIFSKKNNPNFGRYSVR